MISKATPKTGTKPDKPNLYENVQPRIPSHKNAFLDTEFLFFKKHTQTKTNAHTHAHINPSCSPSPILYSASPAPSPTKSHHTTLFAPTHFSPPYQIPVPASTLSIDTIVYSLSHSVSVPARSESLSRWLMGSRGVELSHALGDNTRVYHPSTQTTAFSTSKQVYVATIKQKKHTFRWRPFLRRYARSCTGFFSMSPHRSS